MKYTANQHHSHTAQYPPLTVREKYAHKEGAMIQSCGWQTMDAYSIWWKVCWEAPTS